MVFDILYNKTFNINQLTPRNSPKVTFIFFLSLLFYVRSASEFVKENICHNLSSEEEESNSGYAFVYDSLLNK